MSRHGLTLRNTFVSSRESGPMILGPFDELGSSSCPPVYFGLGRALASEDATEVMATAGSSGEFA